MTSQELQKFDKYLCARLGVKSIYIISADISAASKPNSKAK